MAWGGVGVGGEALGGGVRLGGAMDENVLRRLQAFADRAQREGDAMDEAADSDRTSVGPADSKLMGAGDCEEECGDEVNGSARAGGGAPARARAPPQPRVLSTCYGHVRAPPAPPGQPSAPARDGSVVGAPDWPTGDAKASAKLQEVAAFIRTSREFAAPFRHAPKSDAQRRLEKVARDAKWAARAGSTLTTAPKARLKSRKVGRATGGRRPASARASVERTPAREAAAEGASTSGRPASASASGRTRAKNDARDVAPSVRRAKELAAGATDAHTGQSEHAARRRARSGAGSRADLAARYRSIRSSAAPVVVRRPHARLDSDEDAGVAALARAPDEPTTAVELDGNLQLRRENAQSRLRLLSALEGGLDALALKTPPFSLELHTAANAAMKVARAGQPLLRLHNAEIDAILGGMTGMDGMDHVDAAVAASMRRGTNIFNTFRGGPVVAPPRRRRARALETLAATASAGARRTRKGAPSKAAVRTSDASARRGANGQSTSPRRGRVALTNYDEGGVVVLDSERVHLRRAAGVMATDSEATGAEHEAMWRRSLRSHPPEGPHTLSLTRVSPAGGAASAREHVYAAADGMPAGTFGSVGDGVNFTPVFARSLVAYKVVAVLYDGGGTRRLFSIFDGVTEYVLGRKMTNHSNGFFVYEDPLEAVQARVPAKSALKDCKRCLLRVLASGKGYRRGKRTLAFPHVTPVAVLDEVDPAEPAFAAAFAAAYGRAAAAHAKRAQVEAL